jgi:hypothetical protein
MSIPQGRRNREVIFGRMDAKIEEIRTRENKELAAAIDNDGEPLYPRFSAVLPW